MAVLAAEVLEQWRAAERLLELLPTRSPDHGRVAAAIEEMRDLYHVITEDTAAGTARAIARSRERIEETRAVLRDARTRVDDQRRE